MSKQDNRRFKRGSGLYTTVDRKTLARALTDLAPLTRRCRSLPGLRCVVLRVSEDGTATLEATDLEVFARIPLEGHPLRAGVAMLEAKGFAAAVRKLTTAKTLTLGTTPDSVSLMMGPEGTGCGYSLPLRDVDSEWPTLPIGREFEGGEGASLPATATLEAIHAVAYAASRYDTQLCSVYVDASEQPPMVVATDGHRLAYTDLPVCTLPHSLILPVNAVADLQRIMKREQGMLALETDGRLARIIGSDGRMLLVRLLEGDYVRWRIVVPKASEVAERVSFDRASLLAAAQAALALAPKRNASQPAQLILNGGCELRSTSDAGSVAIPLECTRESEAVSVFGVNARYLAEALDHFEGERVSFGVQQPSDRPSDQHDGMAQHLNAALLAPEHPDSGCRAIVMPRRL